MPLDTGCALCSCSVRVHTTPRTRTEPVAAPDAGGASPARGHRRPRGARLRHGGRGVAGVALPEPPGSPLRRPGSTGQCWQGGRCTESDEAACRARDAAPPAPWPTARLRLAGPPCPQHPAPAQSAVPPAGGPRACGLAGDGTAGGAHPAPAVPHAGHRGRAGLPTGAVPPTGPDAITRAAARPIARPTVTAIARPGAACSAGARVSAAATGTAALLAATAQAARAACPRIQREAGVNGPSHAHNVTLQKRTRSRVALSVSRRTGATPPASGQRRSRGRGPCRGSPSRAA